MKKISVAFFIVVSIFHIQSSKIHAQQTSFSLSPVLIRSVIKPGQEFVQEYSLLNQGDPTLIKLKVVRFEAKDSTGQILLKNNADGPIRFDLSDDINALNTPFLIKNNELKKLNLKIRVPDGAPAGDYYYSFAAESQPPPTLEGAASLRAKITLASNLLITVTKDGALEIKPKIVLFQVIPSFKFAGQNFFDSLDQIPAVFTVENSGKNLIKGNVTFELKSFLQNKTYRIGEQYILSQSQKNFPLTTKEFHLGGYTLTAKIEFGQTSVYSSIKLVALPFKIIFLVASTVFIIFLMRRYFS